MKISKTRKMIRLLMRVPNWLLNIGSYLMEKTSKLLIWLLDNLLIISENMLILVKKKINHKREKLGKLEAKYITAVNNLDEFSYKYKKAKEDLLKSLDKYDVS